MRRFLIPSLWVLIVVLVVAIQRDTFVRRWLVSSGRQRSAQLQTRLARVEIKRSNFQESVAEISRLAAVPVALTPGVTAEVARDAKTYTLDVADVSLEEALQAILLFRGDQWNALVVDSTNEQISIRFDVARSRTLTGGVIRIYDLHDFLSVGTGVNRDGVPLSIAAREELEDFADSVTGERPYYGLGNNGPRPHWWIGNHLVLLASDVGHQRWAEALSSMRSTGQVPFRLRP